MQYKRILLKLSGEALMGGTSSTYDISFMDNITHQIKEIYDKGVEVCLVIGGGNIFRGQMAKDIGIERTSADYMGMLATVMNALALQSRFETEGISTRVLSAIPMNTVCEPFIKRRANRHLEKGRVVIFAAGTGNPFFTTDSAAALRAVELDCEILLKGTQVDGVYDSDPKKNPDAKRFTEVSYTEVLSKNLNVMDGAAIAIARDNKMPIGVFNIHSQGELGKIVAGQGNFTLVK
jgi:uridylate kinase